MVFTQRPLNGLILDLVDAKLYMYCISVCTAIVLYISTNLIIIFFENLIYVEVAQTGYTKIWSFLCHKRRNVDSLLGLISLQIWSFKNMVSEWKWKILFDYFLSWQSIIALVLRDKIFHFFFKFPFKLKF